MYYMWLYVANPAKQGFAKSETVRELVRLAAKVPCGAGYHHPSIPPSLFALRASHLQKKEKRRKEGGKPLPAVNSKPGRSPVVCSLCRHSVPPRVIERARNRSRDTHSARQLGARGARTSAVPCTTRQRGPWRVLDACAANSDTRVLASLGCQRVEGSQQWRIDCILGSDYTHIHTHLNLTATDFAGESEK